MKHCSVNPIELAWAGMKTYIHDNSTNFRLSDVERLASEWTAVLYLSAAPSYVFMLDSMSWFSNKWMRMLKKLKNNWLTTTMKIIFPSV